MSHQYVLSYDNSGGESHIRAESHFYNRSDSTMSFFDKDGILLSILSVQHPWSLHLLRDDKPNPEVFQAIP